MPYFVYILKCCDGTYYTGCTNNLKTRLKQHNQAKNGAHYTKLRRPVILVYQEKYKTLTKARAREAQIKTYKRNQKELLCKRQPRELI